MNAQECTLEAMDVIVSLYKVILPIHGQFRFKVVKANSDCSVCLAILLQLCNR